MNYLTMPFFKALLHKKETKIALGFSLFPLLFFIVRFFDTKFMQLSAPEGTLSFIEFFEGLLGTQYQMILSTLVFIYLSVMMFRDEISTGVMYLYKDVNRRTIMNAKFGAMILLQLLFVGLNFLTGLFTYYTLIVHEPYASGDFLPHKQEDLQYVFVSIVGVVCVFLLCSMVANLASIMLTSGFAMLVSMLFVLASLLAPLLDTMRYFFPNGYIQLFETLSFPVTVLATLLVFIAYSVVLYYYALHKYKQVEF